MLDPLIALGLAGIVLQIVQSRDSLISFVQHVRLTGNLEYASDLETKVSDAKHLVELIVNLVPDSRIVDETHKEKQVRRA